MSRCLCALVCAAGFILSPAAARAEEPFENLTIEQALEKAGKEKKVVMIDFYTTWCGPCKMLDRNTWPNPEVLQLLKSSAVSVKVDCDRARDVCQKYRVSSYPQIVFLRPDGTEIERRGGYMDPKEFIRVASGPLTGKDSLTTAKEAAERSPTDMNLRMAYADALAQRGKAEEAVTQYLWCLDNGTHAPSDAGDARIALVVAKIAAMGRTHPAAVSVLEQRRDAALKALTGAAPGTDAAEPAANELHESALIVLSIDRALRKTDRSMELYETLKAEGPSRAPARGIVGMLLMDSLWSSKRYEDIVRDCGDPIEQFDRQLERYQKSVATNANLDPRLLEFMKQSLTNAGARYYEALVGTRQDEAAKALMAKMVKFDQSGRTFATLITHAARAGRVDVARDLADQARKTLPVAEHSKIEAATKNLPTEAAKNGGAPDKKNSATP